MLLQAFIFPAVKWSLSSQCFSLMFKSRQIISASDPIMFLHILLLFWSAVIYCSACALKLPLNPQSCGSDSCSRTERRCFNARIIEFKVWAMVSFCLNRENRFWINWTLGKCAQVQAQIERDGKRLACMQAIREGSWRA